MELHVIPDKLFQDKTAELLRRKCLELFKVVSHGGVPEVWLLGQKLLELGSPPGGRTGS